jgi:hypothetical protein
MRNLKNFLLWVFVVTIVAFPYQCYYDYQQNVIEIQFYRNYVKPPFNCGPRGKLIHEIGWIEWIGHALWKDQANQDCMNYIRKITQSPWPNLIQSFSKTFVRIGEIPILMLMSGLASGLQEYARSVLITLLVPVIVIGLWYVYAKHYQQSKATPPAYTTTTEPVTPESEENSSVQFIWKELKQIYGECIKNEDFITPHCDLIEQHRAKLIQEEIKPLLEMDAHTHTEQLLLEAID